MVQQDKNLVDKLSCSLNMECFEIPSLFLSLLLLCTVGVRSSGNQMIGDQQEAALLDFRAKITSDPFGILDSWSKSNSSSSSSLHFCKWAGVGCDGSNRRVTKLVLSSQLLRGSISPSIANLTSLQKLSLQNNSFSGEIPPGIGSLADLRILTLHSNLLTGEIPANISGWADLVILNLGGNKLTGKIPNSLGGSSKLQYLSLQYNSLTGGVPPSLANISSLEVMALTVNNLVGTIPESFGRLKKLYFLSMGGNFLTGTIPSSIYNISSLSVLAFPQNQLQGTIPPDIGILLPDLVNFNIGDNDFTGEIPVSLSNASNLERLTIAINPISGTLPSMEKLHKLWWLSISDSLLGTGQAGDLDFFSTIRNLSRLQLVSVANNNFGGSLPGSVANFTELSILRVDGNKISGRIPEGMANLKKLEWLDMANNQFTGSIPEELGMLRNLKKLHLQGNKFSDGRIPSSFGNLSQLTHLHMQQSSIQGSIPPSLGNCRNLLSLNLDGNNLAGEVPGEILSIESLTIYLGSFGSVYKGIDPGDGEKIIAVKVLNLLHPAASKSFRAECEVLGAVRHRNLVKLLTSCSSVDAKGNEFKALVYEFMANGSLDEWLHQDPEFETDPGSEFLRRRRLNLLERLNIAIDVANALEYLHHGLKTPIVHCDLKPGNVLLNHEMMGLVGDFGLARLFPEATAANLSSSLSSSFGVRGTIGYTAPEYGIGYEVSTTGDVYSYGILLLEMFTGKRPTDQMFKDGLNLHRHAKVSSWMEAREILDVVLVEEIEGASISVNTSNTVQECIVWILRLGVAASVESPGERMRISDVGGVLVGIRDTLAEDW